MIWYLMKNSTSLCVSHGGYRVNGADYSRKLFLEAETLKNISFPLIKDVTAIYRLIYPLSYNMVTVSVSNGACFLQILNDFISAI